MVKLHSGMVLQVRDHFLGALMGALKKYKYFFILYIKMLLIKFESPLRTIRKQGLRVIPGAFSFSGPFPLPP